MPETPNLNQTQIQLLRNEPRVPKVLLLSIAVPNISPQILALSLTLPRGLRALSLLSHHLLLPFCWSSQFWMCLLLLHSCYSVSSSFPTHANTYIHTCAHTHTYTLTYVHAQTCTHLSKPPFKSQLKCQETQESLCLGLGQISLL